VPYPRYNNYERGLHLPAEAAKRIKDATPGITGDYILWGDENGLTVEILRKLRSDNPDIVSEELEAKLRAKAKQDGRTLSETIALILKQGVEK
jgi:hypothetical protein